LKVAQAKSYSRLGTDLALTRYVGTASNVPLEVADSWGALDLAVGHGGKGGLRAYAGALDLVTVSGRQNLAQALILRLLTPVGSLEHLAHATFGSRLHTLIGALNDGSTRNRARLYTLEALEQEPRIRRPVLDLDVRTASANPDVLEISFSVLPIDDADPLALALEVTL
jgi:phage baseplate assembly protein W